MANKLTGHQIFKNYRGKLNITCSDCSVILTDISTETIYIAATSNYTGIIPCGSYRIDVTTNTNENIKILINDNIVENGSIIDVFFKDNLDIKSSLDIEIISTSATLFKFTGNKLIEYIGSEPNIKLPLTYSKKYEEVINCPKAYINDPSEWGTGTIVVNKWDYINYIAFTDGNVTHSFTTYEDFCNISSYFTDISTVYMCAFNFKNGTSARPLFSTSSSYNIFKYPLSFYYNEQVYIFEEYSGSSTTEGTLAYFFNKIYKNNTECEFIESGQTFKEYIDGNDYNVTTVADSAFSNNTIIESVMIPDGYTTLGYSAFEYCSNLKYIHVADTVRSASSYLTDQCALEEVYIGKTLRENNKNNCSITSDGKIIINDVNFSSDIKGFIMEVEFDETFSSTDLPTYTFYGGGFTNLELPDSIETVQTYAIHENSRLKEIVFGSKIKSFKSNIISGSKNLEKLTIKTLTPPTIDSSSFSGTNSTFKIYVPSASLSSYKTATNWSNYASRIYPIE